MEKSEIMQRVEAFPGVPETVSRLLTLLDDPETPVDEIEAVLRYDPGLTANILKMANGAYFGFANRISSVRQAVVLLGAKRLTQLVMTSCVNALMEGAVPGYDLPPGELWRHSIAVSVAAEGLAERLGVQQREEVFTAALLHDIGKLVLGSFIADDLDRIDAASAPGLSFEVAEREVLGTDHAEIGATILESWSFPEEMVAAVRHHHDPDQALKAAALIDIVHVANVLCLMIGIGVGREGLQYAPSPTAAKRLGLKATVLEEVASHTLLLLDQLSEQFNLNEALP